MLVLGLTGGIGSGKTTVASIFETFGVPIYNSDQRAKWLMNNDDQLRSEVISLFGEEAYTSEGLNRPFIASKAFADKSLLSKLNAIVHPIVARDFEEWKSTQNSEIVVKEAAVLIESGAFKQVDKVVVVSAPVDVRISRVVNRDKVSVQEVEQRIKNQLSEEERLKYADFVIQNDGTKMLIPQVRDIMESLKK